MGMFWGMFFSLNLKMSNLTGNCAKMLMSECSSLKERGLSGAAALTEEKKSIVKEAERPIFAPTRAENRPEFNAAPVKDRMGYEKVSLNFDWKSSLSTYTCNPEVTAASSDTFFGGCQKALWEM